MDQKILLIQLLQHVPVDMCSYRMKYISEIMSVALSSAFNSTQVEGMIAECKVLSDSLGCVKIGKLEMNLLWEAAITTGNPYTYFLAPPVDVCIVCKSALSTHNKPVTAICYTRDGPLVAVKITLRCDTCGINYR